MTRLNKEAELYLHGSIDDCLDEACIRGQQLRTVMVADPMSSKPTDLIDSGAIN